MDSAMEAKLNLFSKSVLGEAKKKSDDAQKKLDAVRKEKTEKKQDEFLEEAYRTIQSGVAKIRRAESEKVLRAENDMRREILKCREQIIDGVFLSVAEKLSEFTEGEGYAECFEKLLAQALCAAGDGKKTVYVTEKDLALIKDSEIQVEAVKERSFIGGVRVLNSDKGIIADYSFGEAMLREKADFLQRSGLSI